MQYKFFLFFMIFLKKYFSENTSFVIAVVSIDVKEGIGYPP